MSRVAFALSLTSALLDATARAQSVPATQPVVPAVDSVAAVPQRDITDVLAKILGRDVPTDVEKEVRPGLSLTLLPSIGYNPSYGAFIGASVALGGWLGDPKTTNLSSGSAGASYSTTGQISVQFKSDFYLPQNTWALKGDWRYLDTSQPTFGLGPSDPEDTQYPMDFVLYRLYQTAYKQVKGPIYVGLGYHFDRYDQIHDQLAAEGQPTPYTLYMGGNPSRTQSSAISANILVDTRDNAINAFRGVFWNASIRSYSKVIGSDKNSQAILSDFRTFSDFPRKSNNVLAIWNLMWLTYGKAPYLDLPAIGWDTYGRSGRGFLQGHIRASQLAYVEFEYRVRFTRNGLWGGVGFVNLTYTSEVNGGPFAGPDPGAGVGLRVKFNKKTNTNLSVDAARGQDEKTRYFFGLQEVF